MCKTRILFSRMKMMVNSSNNRIAASFRMRAKASLFRRLRQ